MTTDFERAAAAYVSPWETWEHKVGCAIAEVYPTLSGLRIGAEVATVLVLCCDHGYAASSVATHQSIVVDQFGGTIWRYGDRENRSQS